MKMETIDRIERMICEQAEKVRPDWAESAQKTEHLRNMVSILEKLETLKEAADGEPYAQRAYANGNGGMSYRRGRNSMGRYTSYRDGYSGSAYDGYAEHDRADDLRRRLEHMAAQVNPEERKILMDAIEMMQ